MNNKKLYQDTFDQFKMSEEALGKVKDMSGKTKNRHMKSGLRVAAAAMVLFMFLAVSNVAVYAATGDTLVNKVSEKVSKTVSVCINGKKAQEEDFKKRVDEDGTEYYIVEMDDKDGKAIVEISETTPSEIPPGSISIDTEYVKEGEDTNKNTAKGEKISSSLEQEGEKVFLIVGKDKKKVDITKDFSDGKAEGIVESNGGKYHYIVSGSIENNDITITRES